MNLSFQYISILHFRRGRPEAKRLIHVCKSMIGSSVETGIAVFCLNLPDFTRSSLLVCPQPRRGRRTVAVVSGGQGDVRGVKVLSVAGRLLGHLTQLGRWWEIAIWSVQPCCQILCLNWNGKIPNLKNLLFFILNANYMGPCNEEKCLNEKTVGYL